MPLLHSLGLRTGSTADDELRSPELLGWMLISIVVIAAVIVAFGGGAMSASMTIAGKDLRMEYERYGRRGQPTELVVSVFNRKESFASLWFSEEYLSAIDIESFDPPATDTVYESGKTTFTIPMADDASTIIVKIRPKTWGRLRGRVGQTGGKSTEFSQFFYP